VVKALLKPESETIEKKSINTNSNIKVSHKEDNNPSNIKIQKQINSKKA
jgi:hypothetical protein